MVNHSMSLKKKMGLAPKPAKNPLAKKPMAVAKKVVIKKK